MFTGLRPHLTAGMALTTAGVMAVAPLPGQTVPGGAAADSEVVHAPVELTADYTPEELANVPMNLLQALVNVPYNEIQALTNVGAALLYSGPWFVGSPTNVWGEDPGDPTHFEAVMQTIFPFPALSGAGNEGDLFYPGIGQQVSLLMNAEIPADPTCESLACLPMMPTGPITGFTWLDQPIWSAMIFGAQKFPLIDNWFQVPFEDITNGNSHFFDPTIPSMQDSGIAHPMFGWDGTISAEQAMQNLQDNPNYDQIIEDDPGLLTRMDELIDKWGDAPIFMPWAGTSYEMDFQAPFDNFFDSLTKPFDPNAFEFPTLEEIGRAFQTLIAGSFLAFNPFVPGGLACAGPCLLPGINPGPFGIMQDTEGIPLYYAFIKTLDDLWPGNAQLTEWLDAYHEGTANVSTPYIMWYESELWRLQNTMFNFDNPLPPDPAIDTSDLLPSLHDINGWLGDYLFNILMNAGILGPYDFDRLVTALFNGELPPMRDFDPTDNSPSIVYPPGMEPDGEGSDGDPIPEPEAGAGTDSGLDGFDGSGFDPGVDDDGGVTEALADAV